MKVLLAGTGSIGRRHAANLRELMPACELVVLRADGRSGDLALQPAAAVVTSWPEALATQPEALIIATPSALHAELLLQGLHAALPMYAEKPVVTTAADLQAVVTAAAHHGGSAPVQVGCNLRFLPSLQRLRQLLQAGAIGRVVRASFEAGQWLPDWRPQQNHRLSYSADPARGGGVVLDLVHEIDAALWLLGDLTPVAAQTAVVPALQIASEAVATALLRSATGALVQIGLDYVARRPVRRYQLIGEEGTLCWDLPRRELRLETPQRSELVDCGEGGFDVAQTYRTAMAEFVAAVQGGAPTSQPLEQGLRTADLALRLKELACPNP
ncbi:MAG: Gfo/Idh/MocA family oxidoreductase [Cyanobacteria bacterium K_Offshore_0m_m2_072]|nr:Gfo/Idh/MocA family oxidoreductase [Cyanobacteria bacterium K_Offshore_0m_m2_072]